MKALDLFSGTQSIAKAFREKGWETFTVELDKDHPGIDWYADIIENPRAALRKMDFMQELPRHTTTYCQYGDTRQKPTDIWTNHPDPKLKPPCKPGSPCHESAPRGSRTGTQGLKGAKERAVIPHELCLHIAEICEE